MLDRLRKIIRPDCPNCNGAGGFMSGYYEPEFSGCRCCNPDEGNEDDITRVWRWRWWIFRFREWREMRRLDRWIDQQTEAMRPDEFER
jgi:hypothetical protein